MLTATDYANALALINRAAIQGNEVEEIAALKSKLLQAHNLAKANEAKAPPNTKYDPADFPISLVKPGGTD